MAAEEQGDWLFVPDAEPIKVIPVQMPGEMDGFRIARPFDGVTEDRQPQVSRERGYVEDAAERDRLQSYLGAGRLALDSIFSDDDLFDPRRRFAVKGFVRTDGVWVWPHAVEFYLQWHNVAPEPEFYRHIVFHRYRVPEVPSDVVAAAGAAFEKANEIHYAEGEAWRAAHQPPPAGDEARFGPAVNEALLRLGWFRGRDVSDVVDPWLAEWMERLAEFRLKERGMMPVEPFPAAVAVLREFGGLVSHDKSSGVTAARSPFVIYPRPGRDYWWLSVVDISQLGGILGKRLFRVGEIEDGSVALLVAEDGQVYTSGTVELFLGETFDQALVTLLEGHEAEPW